MGQIWTGISHRGNADEDELWGKHRRELVMGKTSTGISCGENTDGENRRKT